MRHSVEGVVVCAHFVFRETVKVFYLVHIRGLPVVRAMDKRVFHVARLFGQVVKGQGQLAGTQRDDGLA